MLSTRGPLLLVHIFRHHQPSLVICRCHGLELYDMLEHHKEYECMDYIHKLLAVFLRSSCVTANASPRLFSWSFVQPSLHMWGDCIAGLAALFLLCARVCEVAVLGSNCSASGSHISVTHDRVKQRRSVSLTKTDEGDRPWLLSSVSYYLVSR